MPCRLVGVYYVSFARTCEAGYVKARAGNAGIERLEPDARIRCCSISRPRRTSASSSPTVMGCCWWSLTYYALKLKLNERCNTYSAYNLEALVVCGVVKHCMCYLVGCYEFLVVTNHDTIRHMLMQPNKKLTSGKHVTCETCSRLWAR
jgi:hypothetical protein